MTQPSSPARKFLRALTALPFLLIAGFCVFGFLASGELSEATQRLPWQIGYSLGGLASLLVAVTRLRPRPSDTSRIRH